MPNDLLLAIESATKRASVALLRGTDVVAERDAEDGDHHAERLLPMVDALLHDADVKLAEVGCFAVSIGPGAFTSLRIGLATLKGLAFETEAPVAVVSTLHALAHAAVTGGRVEPGELCVPLLDARRGELYGGVYRRAEPGKDRLESAVDDFVYSPEELGARFEGPVRLVGEGAGIFGDALVRAAADRAEVRVDPGEPVWPDARSVGAIGVALLAAGEGRSVAGLVPSYLRRAQAEEERVARRSD